MKAVGRAAGRGYAYSGPTNQRFNLQTYEVGVRSGQEWYRDTLVCPGLSKREAAFDPEALYSTIVVLHHPWPGGGTTYYGDAKIEGWLDEFTPKLEAALYEVLREEAEKQPGYCFRCEAVTSPADARYCIECNARLGGVVGGTEKLVMPEFAGGKPLINEEQLQRLILFARHNAMAVMTAGGVSSQNRAAAEQFLYDLGDQRELSLDVVLEYIREGCSGYVPDWIMQTAQQVALAIVFAAQPGIYSPEAAGAFCQLIAIGRTPSVNQCLEYVGIGITSAVNARPR